MNQSVRMILQHWRIFALPCLAAGAAQAIATLCLTIEGSAAFSMMAALTVAAMLTEAHFDVLSGLRTSLRESAAAALSQAGPLAVLIATGGLIATAAPRWIMGELLRWFLLPCVAFAIPVCVMERRGPGDWMGAWGLWLYPLVTAHCAAAVTACYHRLRVAASGRPSASATRGI